MPTIVKDLGYFAAAHNLTQHEGGCWNLHGHNYRVEVAVTGPLQEEGPSRGMVIDFSDIKDIYKSKIHTKLDHAYILAENKPDWYLAFTKLYCDFMGSSVEQAETVIDGLLGKVAHLPIVETTAECMSEWIANEMQEHMPDDVLIVWLKLYETETSYAQWWVK